MATMQMNNNDENEKNLLATLLLDNSIIDMVSGKITKDHFSNSTCKKIYIKMCEQWKSDKHFDPITLAGNDTDLKVKLSNLTDNLPSTANWNFYANKLQIQYKLKRLRSKFISSGEKITTENINQIIAEVEAELSACSSDNVDSVGMNKLAISAVEDIQKAFNSKRPITGYESGFTKLDEVLDGFQTGAMYVIGARPSIGKTAFALALAQGIASKGVKTTIFSLEMSDKSLFFRMLSAVTDIPMRQIKKGMVYETPRMVEKTNRGIEKLFSLPINVMDSGVDIDKVLYSRIRYEARVNKVKVFFIDHLGLIDVTDSSGQRYVDVGRITKTLHKMVKELDICIVLLCQCGREAEGKKPNLSLLRESGNIEQDSDIIMLLHRQRELDDEKEKENPLKEFPTDVIIAKNRDGRTGTATFSFKPVCMRFREDISRSALDELGERNDRFVKKEKVSEIPY